MREGDGAARARAAAPDRRRDDLAPAHGGADRARVRPRDRARARRLARRRRRLRPARPRPARPRSTRRTASEQERLRELARREGAAAAAAARGRAREPRAARLRRPARPGLHRRPRRSSPSLAELRAVHRLAVLLPRLGAEGQVPGDPRAAGGARALRRRDRAARRDRARRARSRRAASTASGRRTPRATTSCSSEGDALPDAAPAGRLRRLAAEPLPRRLRRARRATTSARSRSGSTAPTSSPARYEAEHDDYRAIMVKALADRLAEAFAEWLHLQARRRWYEPERAPSSEELIAERYRGIRPAFGYPACPDHSEKRTLFDLLGAEAVRARADRELCDDARRGGQRPLLRPPAGAVLRRRAHPARPGRGLRRAQGRRRCEEAERWLRPNLAYDPAG